MPFSVDYDGSIVSILEQLRVTAELEGIAVIDLAEEEAATPIAYLLGHAGADTTEIGQAMLRGDAQRPTCRVAADQRPILACPWTLPPSRPGGLLLWRSPGAREWNNADNDLAAAVAMLLAMTIGASIGQPAIDRLTSLPNRRWFIDEADRRIDRLELDGRVGTLLLVDIDDLHRVNQFLGRTEGDRILARLAGALRAAVRPADLVARIGADEFALWLDEMDHLTAAERAEDLCGRRLFHDLPGGQAVSFSIGIASREPGDGEDVRTLLRRAHMAAREVKAKGGGGWRVSPAQPISRCSDR